MQRFISKSIVALCLLLQSMACSAESLPITLHPGDRVTVTVFNHPELTSEPTLDGKGRISVPLVGAINAQDLNLEQLAEKITQALRRYVIRPAVDVRLLAGGTSIFVVGPVAGVLNYTPGESLVAALSEVQRVHVGVGESGGSSPQNPASAPTIDLRALRESGVDLRHVVLRRDGIEHEPIDVEQLIAQGEAGPILVSGDVLSLRQRPVTVDILGVVAHPINAHLYRDEPLRDALRQAGGVDQTDSRSRMTLIRQGVSSEITIFSPAFSLPAVNGDALIISQAPRVVVAGQVIKPGQLTVQGDASLLSVLYLAGGPQNNGDLNRVIVLHQGKQVVYNLTRVKHGILENNPILVDGDSVFVPAAHRTDFGQIFQGIIAASTLHFI